MPDKDLAFNKRKARDILDRIHVIYKHGKSLPDALSQLRGLMEDHLAFVLLAKLWQAENIDKAIEAYKTAIEIHTLARTADGEYDSELTSQKMTSNLGVLYLLGGKTEAAMATISEVYGKLQSLDESEELDQLRTTVLYNLGRCFEADNNSTEAIVAYEELLKRHPEYVQGRSFSCGSSSPAQRLTWFTCPAKLSLAELYLQAGRKQEAETKLREAQLTHPNDVLVRAAVSSLLITQERWDVAYSYATETRRVSTNDVYALCVLGAIHYRRARESRAEEIERNKEYCKSAEAFSQALVVDPGCTIAAQGLAIAIAEDVIPSRKGGKEPTNESRLQSIETALGIFNRIKDSRSTPAVLINSGHCMFAKGDEDRAVESVSSFLGLCHISRRSFSISLQYTAASTALEGKDAQVLLYLARAHQAVGTKKLNFESMNKALASCQKVSQPSELQFSRSVG